MQGYFKFYKALINTAYDFINFYAATKEEL